jgi:predicted Ser/Thr protein kinase
MTTKITTESGADSKLYLPRDPFPHPFPGMRNVLKDLLKVVRKHPAYVESSHSAFHRLNARNGIDDTRTAEVQRLTGDESITAYSRITSTFFGVETPVYKILTGYGLQASLGGGTRKKALVLTGSPGAGKSDFVNFQQRNVMRTREPIPVLKFGVNFVNPLNALYLAKLIAETKSGGLYDATLAELVKIIDGLELTGDAELNFSNSNLATVAAKHGFKAGQKLSSADLAEICMTSEKDFVAVICYGLDLPTATVDALYPSAGLMDPYVKDVVLGRFFGKNGPNAPSLSDFDEKIAEAGKPQAKKRNHPTYGEYDARYAVELGEFPLDTMFMSKGHGILDIAEVQPINFDLAVWRGRMSLANMGLYASNDPRILDLSGYFNRGKFIIHTEGLRNPDEGFRVLLEGLEGGRLSLPDGFDPTENPDGIGFEGVNIIHSNDEQWNKFYANPAHRAHLDRFAWVSFPYPLEPTQAARVTEKLWTPLKELGIHHEPLAFPYSGFFRVATHIDWASKGNRPLLAVLRAYDGKQVRERMMGTDIDLRALREQAPWTEGLTGMSPRALNDIIGQLAAESQELVKQGKRPSACFTTAELRDRLKREFKNNPSMNKKDKELWIGWLDNEFESLRRQELTKVYKAAFIPNFRDLCTQFFKKYVAYVRALSLGIKPTGTVGGQAITQRDMEAFLQEVERADEFNVNSAQAPKFRQGVMAAINLFNEEHGTSEPPYDVHEGLKNCIESYVLRQAKDITGVVGITNLSEEEQRKLDSAKARLIDEHHYCDYCAGKLLIEVALTRDFLKA